MYSHVEDQQSDPEKIVMELADASRRLDELEKESPEAAEASRLVEQKRGLLKKLEEHYQKNRITYVPYYPVYPAFPVYPYYPTWYYNPSPTMPLTLTYNAAAATTTAIFPTVLNWNSSVSASPVVEEAKEEENNA